MGINAGNLGQILQVQGDLAGGRRYAERALMIHAKVYGPEHPTVATSANNLGQILQAQGDLAGARRYTERALEILRVVYGAEHPMTITVRNNLKAIELPRVR